MARGNTKTTHAIGRRGGAMGSTPTPADALAAASLAPRSAYAMGAVTAEQILADEHDPHHAGLVIPIAGGAELVCGPDVGRYGPQGLSLVSQVTAGEPMVVSFADGARAEVSGEPWAVRCSCAHNPCPHRIAALYHHAAADDPALAAALADLDQTDPDALATAAHLGEIALSGRPGEVSFVPAEGTHGTSAPSRTYRAEPSSASAVLNQMGLFDTEHQISSDTYEVADLADVVEIYAGEMGDDALAAEARQIADAAEPDDEEAKRQLLGLLERYERDELPFYPQADLMAQRRHAARTNGFRIPEPNPYYEWDETLGELNMAATARLNLGQRAFCVYGPPGTGKSSWLRELAAAQGMPVCEIDMSSGVSVEELLGVTSFDPDKGTTYTPGILTRAAGMPGGCMIILNEAVDADPGLMTALHNAIGSGFGEDGMPEERYIAITSAEAQGKREEYVDPNTLWGFTWNPGEAGREMGEAIMSRSLVYELPAVPAEKEADRVFKILYRAVGKRMGWNYDPSATTADDQGNPVPVPPREQCPEVWNEIKTDADLFATLRDAYYSGGGRGIRRFPDARALVAFSGTRLQEDVNDPDGRVRGLTAALPGVSGLLSLEYRDPEAKLAETIELISDHHPEVNSLLVAPANNI